MRRVLLLLLPCFSAAIACGSDGPRCTTSADCESGRCIDGMCRPGVDGAGGECDSADDCDDGNACNGVEQCSGAECGTGTPASDGTECDADGQAATRNLCADGVCAPTRCGDGVTDAESMEECDDGNDVAGDGCESCSFGCENEGDCADGEECNGAETCNTTTHACAPGAPAMDGADCLGAIGTCQTGRCVPRSCMEDLECTDADMCTGTETCASMMCAAGEALVCDDMIACTEDTCDAASGCAFRLVDADRDGHPPASLGACGDDCDDDNAVIYGGAPDGCDGLDNDCDMRTDEDEATVWYADCDADGYARMGATSITSCAEPAPSLSGCMMGGDFTARAPADAANTDCNDQNATVRPNQTMYQTTAITGAPTETDYDYDCDTAEERGTVAIAACVRIFGSACFLAMPGWVGAAPECGVGGTWASVASHCVNSGGTCIPVTGTPMTQSCL